MNETDLLKLLDSIVSLSLLLLVWQLERKRVTMLETKLTKYENMLIDEHKINYTQSIKNNSDG